MADLEDSPFDLIQAIYSKETMIALDYQAYYVINPAAPYMSYEDYHWLTIPDDFENCGGYIP